MGGGQGAVCGLCRCRVFRIMREERRRGEKVGGEAGAESVCTAQTLPV